MNAILNLADMWDHHDGGGWWVMGIGMVLIVIVLLVGLVVVMRYGLYSVTERPGRHGDNDPLEILDRRLALGEITAEEYTDKRVALGYGPKPERTD
jgi:uncharacterized membrane protein